MGKKSRTNPQMRISNPRPTSHRAEKTLISSCLKYMLFLFNFIFWFVGCALILVGIYAYLEGAKYSSGSTEIKSIFDVIFNVAIMVIIGGGLIFILAFAGCIGALRENVCLLKFFSIVLMIIFLCELVCGVLMFVFNQKAKTAVNDVLKDELIPKFREPGQLDLENLINWIQETFACCGVEGDNGYLDWSRNKYYNCTDDNKSAFSCAVPFSCCRKANNIEADIVNKMCGYGAQKLSITPASKNIYTTGCIDAVTYQINSNMYIVGGILIGVAIIQIMAIFMGFTLARQIQDQIKRWRMF